MQVSSSMQLTSKPNFLTCHLFTRCFGQTLDFKVDVIASYMCYFPSSIFCMSWYNVLFRNTIFRNFRDQIAGRWAVTQVAHCHSFQKWLNNPTNSYSGNEGRGFEDDWWIERLWWLQEELPSSQAIHYPPNLKVNLSVPDVNPPPPLIHTLFADWF